MNDHQETGHGPCDPALAPNTHFELMYRDASNYKTCLSVVLAGQITADDIRDIGARLDDGCLFIAHQVGLPSPSEQFRGKDDFPNDDLDHVFTTLCAFDNDTPTPASMHTADEATLPMTVSELVEAMRNVVEWDSAAEWDRMSGVLAPSVSTLVPPAATPTVTAATQAKPKRAP